MGSVLGNDRYWRLPLAFVVWLQSGAYLRRWWSGMGGGHRHRGWDEIFGLRALLGQVIHVGDVHVLVLVPAEAIKWDQRQLIEVLLHGGGVATGPAQQDGPQQQHKDPKPVMLRVPHRHTSQSSWACSCFLPFLSVIEQSPNWQFSRSSIEDQNTWSVTRWHILCDKAVPEMDSRDGCTTLWMHLKLRNCTL